jgi:beta-lactamase superfamily II metal-dependent hydrolase
MATRKQAKARKSSRRSASGGRSRPQTQRSPAPASSPVTAAGGSATGLRVRMFRVGFGDFFLVTVPTLAGAKNILIDCGVHAKDLGTIRDAVAQMAEACNSQLALIIVTHRHADHISGFGTCRDIFSKFTVERVWMSWFENPGNATAVKFQAGISALAGQIRTSLAARGDADDVFYARMMDNITGGMITGSLATAGAAGNQVALEVIHGGFKNKPEYNYYQAGDQPTLPQDLIDAGLSAEILGPPIDPALVSQMTNKNDQYLSGFDPASNESVQPFAPQFKGDIHDYPKDAFSIYRLDDIKKLIGDSQPNTLAARAAAADNTLNNQSLVLLFSFRGKTLLFAGDAQWGNWENFLYGGAYGTPGHTEITEKAKAILGQIDFYKVGHHGSTNATPKDAVTAMRRGCVGMCSTQPGAYNEVPRAPLLQALSNQMGGQLARSDQIPANAATPPTADAGPLPSKFKDPTGTLFVDYEF